MWPRNTTERQLKVSVSDAIISLNLVCLLWTYLISTACVLHRRIYSPELLPKASYTLGPFGVIINIAALVYSAFAFFWSFWPNKSTHLLEDFNWAIVMFPAAFIVATIDWILRARHVYFGPMREVVAPVGDGSGITS